MRDSWREADRAAAVREAVHGWRQAGLVSAETAASALEQWPAQGPSLGPLWRALVALFTAAGAAALTGGFAALNRIDSAGEAAVLLALFGAALAAATEWLLARFHFAPTGAEAATSALALLFLCAAAGISAHESLPRHLEQRAAIGAVAALLAAAAWRWGFRAYAAGGAAAGFLLLASLPVPRALWLAGGACAALASTRALRLPDLVPSHRGGLELARAVALAALYLGVNYASVDHGLIESLVGPWRARTGQEGATVLAAALLATAAFPPGLLLWGVRSRDRGVLALGVIAAAASLATIRLYHQVAPLWAVLAGAGGLLAGGSLLVERWLRDGPEGERGGFTAAPLYHEGRRERLLPLAAALAAAPAARDLPREPQGGGGGAFGGGGAGGEF